MLNWHNYSHNFKIHMIKVTLCLALFLLTSSQGGQGGTGGIIVPSSPVPVAMTHFVQVKGQGTYYQPPTIATVLFQIQITNSNISQLIINLNAVQAAISKILTTSPLMVPAADMVYSNFMVYTTTVNRVMNFVASENLAVNVSCANFSMHMAAMVIDGLASLAGVTFVQVSFNSIFDKNSEDMARKSAYMSAMYKAQDYAYAAMKSTPSFPLNLMSYPKMMTECDASMMSLFSHSMQTSMKEFSRGKDSYSRNMMSSKPIPYILTRCVMAYFQFTN